MFALYEIGEFDSVVDYVLSLYRIPGISRSICAARRPFVPSKAQSHSTSSKSDITSPCLRQVGIFQSAFPVSDFLEPFAGISIQNLENPIFPDPSPESVAAVLREVKILPGSCPSSRFHSCSPAICCFIQSSFQ